MKKVFAATSLVFCFALSGSVMADDDISAELSTDPTDLAGKMCVCQSPAGWIWYQCNYGVPKECGGRD
jgi:hypothetical protein